MPNPENIAPHRFTTENQPKNRRSRKGVPNRSTLLNEWLDVKRRIPADRNPTGKAVRGTVEDEVILALIAKALCGDVAAIREVLDTRYGKATERREVGLTVDLANDPEARLELARASLQDFTTNIDGLVDESLAEDPTADRAERDCWTDPDFRTNYAYHLEHANRLLEDEDFPARASLAQIRTALTRCVRFERFCEGQLEGLLRSGFIAALLRRLSALREGTGAA